eukprot:EG_transcript_40617
MMKPMPISFAWRFATRSLLVPTSNPKFQLPPFRCFATIHTPGTHPDFAPKAKNPQEEDLEAAIEEMKKDIQDNHVVLFMKGEPKNPQCGFSAKVVQILAQYGQKYIAYNVLADPLIRAGVKKISNWPTIPQLYVNGEFVGGCDIVTEMHNNNEL